MIKKITFALILLLINSCGYNSIIRNSNIDFSIKNFVNLFLSLLPGIFEKKTHGKFECKAKTKFILNNLSKICLYLAHIPTNHAYNYFLINSLFISNSRRSGSSKSNN